MLTLLGRRNYGYLLGSAELFCKMIVPCGRLQLSRRSTHADRRPMLKNGLFCIKKTAVDRIFANV
jgi:hypothetical protein